MFLLVGLGNPGPKYGRHRHNVGFMALDRFAQHHAASAFRERFSGAFSKGVVSGHDVVLLKPMTYMNLSGRSVQQAMHFFKIALHEVVVVHDELDLPFGTLRVKVDGGTAGHNGLGSITESCGGTGFGRIRVGIGRPQSGNVEGFVLSDFSSTESNALDDVLERATAALTDIVVRGTQAAMNAHNQKAVANS